MKTCSYCGRQNEDGAATCAGCGTALEEAPILSPKTKARRRWPDLRLRYAGYAVGVVLLYFLSFGPVMYLCAKVTVTSGTVGPTYTTSVSVQLPGWVGFVYYPALALYTSQTSGGAYDAYVHWWIERREGKK